MGTAVPSTNGKLVVALQGSIEELDFETGRLIKLSSIEDDRPSNRYNEGKCDAVGRFWIGTMNVDVKPKEGALYKFDRTVNKILDKRSVSNGICWSNDNQTMYYIDSFDYNIKAYDFDSIKGNISNERIVVKIDGPNHIPDGMCIDEQGMLWVAIWGCACVHRYNPFDGTLIGIVYVDALNVTSCALGGENMDRLFITTARVGLSDEQLLQYPLSGSFFIAETKIKGLPANCFSSISNSRL